MEPDEHQAIGPVDGDPLRRSPSRPGEFHPEPLTGRVGGRRAGLGPKFVFPLTCSFACECHTISTLPRFQPATLPQQQNSVCSSSAMRSLHFNACLA
jgi:hypothetical protein